MRSIVRQNNQVYTDISSLDKIAAKYSSIKLRLTHYTLQRTKLIDWNIRCCLVYAKNIQIVLHSVTRKIPFYEKVRIITCMLSSVVMYEPACGLHTLMNFYHPQRSWGKVMFLHVCMILFKGGDGGGGCYPNMHCRWYLSMPYTRFALQEKGLISKLEITCLLIIIISLNFFWIKYFFHFRILVSYLWSSQADIANSYLRNLIDTTVKTVMEIFS